MFDCSGKAGIVAGGAREGKNVCEWTSAGSGSGKTGMARSSGGYPKKSKVKKKKTWKDIALRVREMGS